ncbi:MAG: DUF1460 domain-containing protein [Xenococcaceae cyanobacterium MO_188.B19]|nr:DUF1460 domain-containing protein [Xenococcaceae cyanobacterium MO_188.B19]
MTSLISTKQRSDVNQKIHSTISNSTSIERGFLSQLPDLDAQKPGQTLGSPMPKTPQEVNHFSETLRRQSSTTETENVKRFHEIMEKAITYNLSDTSMGHIMQAVAEQFLGTDYKAGLLDRSKQETLFISLKNFDCVLFIETVLAIARNIALKDYQYQTFTNHIVEQRYRNGRLNGYCSRLHYFLEWISDNQKRGTVKNMAPDLGGIALKKKLNFMSTNPSRYPQLANNNANYQCIVEMEANLQPLKIDYIPKNQIKSMYAYLQPGDIIGIATNIPGLDTTHTGLIYRNSKGQTGLLHASPIGKVTIAPDLQRYVNNVKHSIGILIARPIDPRQIKNAFPQ